MSQQAEKKEIWLKEPDGNTYRYSRWLKNKKVKDGSAINVSKKVEKEPLDVTEFSKEVASILSDFAQLVLLISAIRSSS